MKKELRAKVRTRSEGEVEFIYKDIDTKEELGDLKIKGVHGYCFCGDKMVIVWSDKKGYWTPPGGGVEPGETYEQALVREIKEETNMKVLNHCILGVQEGRWSRGSEFQTRSVCTVKPYGDFVSDPDGDINKIALIDPADAKKYFDWGHIGEHVLERALRKVKRLK